MSKKQPTPPAPLTDHEAALRDELRRDVEKLAGEIGERHCCWLYEKLDQSADWIEDSLTSAGCQVERQSFEVDQCACYNVIAEIAGKGRADEIVVVGAHYDSVTGSPGANDNASGVAAVLALARAFAGAEIARTLRLVAFANEEPPFFKSDEMGSFVYAQSCREREDNILGMLSLETIGYYSHAANSQHYPFPLSFFYPSTGNFIGFVGNLASRKLVRQITRAFKQHTDFACESAAVPGVIAGVDWSDHWSFWKHGFPAVMVTDTALFRYPHYHTPEDTPDKLDYDGFTRVTAGLAGAVGELVGLVK